jgi:hypothetical protein
MPFLLLQRIRRLRMDAISRRTRKRKHFRLAWGTLVFLTAFLLAAMSQTSLARTDTPKRSTGWCDAEFSGDCPKGPARYVEVKNIAFTVAGKPQQKWRAIAFQDDARRPGPAELRFCADSCRQRFKAVAANGKTVYKFQSVKDLLLVSLLIDGQPSDAVLFHSEHNPDGGSGSLQYLTLWLYRPETKKFVNVLPKVFSTEQGECKFFTRTRGPEEGVLVTADFIWGDDETHFARHRYKLEIYKFDPHRKTYALYKEYETKTKYASLDETDKINVITPELRNIRALLK